MVGRSAALGPRSETLVLKKGLKGLFTGACFFYA